MPKYLILVDVEGDGREVAGCKYPWEWEGVGCARCEQSVAAARVAYLVGTEVSCALCLTPAERGAGETRCEWCGAIRSTRREDKRVVCDSHWATHTAFVADGVDPAGDDYQRLMEEVTMVLREQEHQQNWEAWMRYLDKEDGHAAKARKGRPTAESLF